MSIRRRSKSITVNGLILTVWESSWDSSMAMSAIEAEARTAREKANGTGDPEFFYFWEKIYPTLAALSTGDVPSPEEAFKMDPYELDHWFEAAREVDPALLGDQVIEPEVVTFRDGSSITVLPDYLPSVLMRLHRLESEVEAGTPMNDVSAETFRILFYPRLAACSTGDVPGMDEARSEWPTSELDKWYNAARRVNPTLFLPLEEIALENRQKAEEAQKKRPRSRRKSQHSSVPS